MLPGASAPPAVGVKVNVAAAPAVPATRSAPATANDTFVTLPPITPDATDTDAVWSTLLCSVTLPPAVGAPPMVRPASVTVTAVLAATVPDCSVMMRLEFPAASARASATPLNATLGGVPPAAKKPEGYISVTVLLAESAPPAVGMKENVATTFTLLTTRPFCAMRKDVKFDEPPITPDATDTDAVWSTLVCSVTLPPAVGALPIVMPVSVTVTEALATRDPEEVVITI